MGHTQPDKTEI